MTRLVRYMVPLFLLLFGGGQVVHSASVFAPDTVAEALVDENVILLEVQVQGERLVDTILQGYQGPVGILLPIGDIGTLLGYTYDEDGYAYVDGLTSIYGVDAFVDVATGVLHIDADEPIPVVQRLKRERDWQLLASRRTAGLDADALRPTPYRLFDLGALDFTVRAGLRALPERDARTARELTLRSAVAGELLFMTALLNVDVVDGQQPRVGRLTLQRMEHGAALLGPLGARQLALWDIVYPGLPLVTGASMGRGLFVSNIPPIDSAAFDTIELVGPLPRGWDVELYRNDILIDFRRSDESGYYKFDGIVLYYGENDLRLVFHGPYGEVVTEQYSYPVSRLLIPSGEKYYQLSAGRDLEGHEQMIARYGLGLGPAVSVDVGAARLPIGDETGRYVTLGLQTLGRSWFAHAQAAGRDDGGRALDVGLRTRWGSTLVSVEQVMLWDFESRRFQRRADPLVGRTTVALSRAWQSAGGHKVPTGLEVNHSQLRSGRQVWRLSHRIGTFAKRANVTNWLHWTAGPADSADKSSQRQLLTGQLMLSKRGGRAGVIYALGYRLHPEAIIQTFGIEVESPLHKDARLRLGLSSSFETSGLFMSAGVHRDAGPVSFGVNGSYNTKGEYRLGISMSTGAARNPPGGRWSPVGGGVTAAGSAAVTVFLDENANGVMDPGEKPLEGVAVSAGPRREPIRTGSDGVALLTGLSAYTPTKFQIATTSLPDIFWTPFGDGITVVPRPGTTIELQLPVVIRGEVMGTTYLREAGGADRNSPPVGDVVDRPVSGVELELVRSDGEVVARTTSGFGGFYVFTDVLPGTYEVRATVEQADRLGVAVADTVDVRIDGGGSSQIDVDVVLHKVSD